MDIGRREEDESSAIKKKFFFFSHHNQTLEIREFPGYYIKFSTYNSVAQPIFQLRYTEIQFCYCISKWKSSITPLAWLTLGSSLPMSYYKTEIMHFISYLMCICLFILEPKESSCRDRETKQERYCDRICLEQFWSIGDACHGKNNRTMLWCPHEGASVIKILGECPL